MEVWVWGLHASLEAENMDIKGLLLAYWLSRYIL